jgi:hypothetical protein
MGCIMKLGIYHLLLIRIDKLVRPLCVYHAFVIYYLLEFLYTYRRGWMDSSTNDREMVYVGC